LAGEDAGELRVRVAVVPGGPEDEASQAMVSLFARQLSAAAAPALQVGVCARA
jgi:hypothetical protein